MTDSYLRQTHVRCSICNAVSNENIETIQGDYRRGLSFVDDPKDRYSSIKHFICVDCDEEIQDIRDDFEFRDSLKE